MSKRHQSTVSNPCIRHCCLNEQDVCLGCFRSLNEITGWSQLDDEQRKGVMEKAKQRNETHRLRYSSDPDIVWLKSASR